MADNIEFTLDGQSVTAAPGETIWDVARRQGNEIPHLCHVNMPGYRTDGNCRACMVDVEGERVLTASCIRKPSPGMVVRTDSERAVKSREMVFELLASNMRPRDEGPDNQSVFWDWVERMGIEEQTEAGAEGTRYRSKFDPARDDAYVPDYDPSHAAIGVNMDACIGCNACVRACREVQVNDVIGMAERGDKMVPVFDMHDPMGLSTCVGCGECVQACPTGALYEKSLMDDEFKTRKVQDFDRIVESVCPFCGVGCQTTMYVKDNRIVQIDGRDGPSNEGRLCVKGRFGFDYAMSPERLTKPLIRRDDAPKAGDIDLRGVDPLTIFREATWEEAMERAAGGLVTIRDRDGGGAIAGFGSAKGSNEEAYLFQKLIRQGFGTNNLDHCARLCHASSVAALMEGIGSGGVSASFMDATLADCAIVIGSRPEVNHPVAATYLKQAAKEGLKLIVMDPRKQELMRFATHSLQFKGGSDVALLNAMLYTIIEEKLYNEEYIKANASGFEALKKKIREFPPEAMAEVCGIEPEVLRQVARLYATSERSMIFWGMGVSQHTHGTDNVRCLIALALITGHVGRPGTGLHPLRGQNNVQGASDVGLLPATYPDYKSVENADIRAEYENFWGETLDPKAGLTAVEIMDAIHDGAIKGMYIMGENPAMSDPDQNHARAALARLEHLVVQDIFLTETAWHADVILPASAHAEKLGTYTNTNRQVQIGRPALDMPGEARQDLDLIIDLARRIGLDWSYDGPADVFREMTVVMPSLANITWERVEREDSVTYPADAPDKPGNWVVFGDGFPTADGRGHIVPTDLLPPDEVPDEEYPLVLTTGRLLEHWHTGAMTRRADVLDFIEPQGIASMNPREINRRKLKIGGMIEIATRRGAVTAILRADRDVADGMVFMPFCFGESPANVLTNPKLDPFGKIPEFKFCAARVSPVVRNVEPAE